MLITPNIETEKEIDCFCIEIQTPAFSG